ncbi:poly-beta-1,6-N-acetyl-D-glucosamine biosynthesis protein PgaD [Escherichia coli]|uniref:poly-beta-1,6-N-acetyl-D-glucosamine biosynthesis protein PgaD n=1 Tax=Escherichia coli TaxID=562 RepID=UPI000B42B4ED|nr:poly-beta-1,6-N-acetyl-D-glucosamine biosynthesis protein PgaD [Escherichia coli]OWC41985.1 poly-beta-1,6-N-acetyl-D-glucosamine biosynthesis protein PgaD [Escherichia coli]RCP65662.1 poly-beta-1,6-N-acetyl-D-glucosamine biosynthesis protein PgaD [Escherichia coli]CAD6082287.1 hemin storage system protein [Escherichia coli]CAD6086070.1 hemin storage system protein [Escherichia coli]CAD6149185.1 hemin storage system protein [Escherichia coli]
MNGDTLILTENRLFIRLFDGVLTLLAWMGFLFFFYANLLMVFTTQSNRRWELIVASFNTVLVYLFIATINGWLLIIWYQYNRRRTQIRRQRRIKSLCHEELARSFNVTPQIISEMSQHNLLTVYHDHIGQIINLKIKSQQHEESQ